MASLNRVILMGNLTRDPQMKYLPSQTPVVEFGLAMNRRFKTPQGEDREETTFVEVSAFGRTAEIINQYCRKGNPLLVEGRLKYDQWDDKQTGAKRSKLSVVVENMQLLGQRPQGAPGAAPGTPSGGPAAGGQRESRAPQSPQATGQDAPPFGDEQHFRGDEVPF